MLLKQLLEEKAVCQGGLQEMDSEVEAEESAEAAKMIIDVVTDLLGVLSKHYGQGFEPYFQPVCRRDGVIESRRFVVIL